MTERRRRPTPSRVTAAKWLLPSAVTLALTIGCMSTEKQVAERVGEDNSTIDALFESWISADSPGCALAVSRAGELVYSRGYGLSNLDHGVPITPTTVFDVGSITKQFTAANLAELHLDGALALDDPVRRWLPELPETDPPITLRQMIVHTSGLRDYLNLFPLAGRGSYYPISHPQILDMMSRQRASIFPAGERYEYSNSAYMLLAQVIERTSDLPLGRRSQERFLDPLGMTGSSMYDDLTQVIPQRATGYGRDPEGRFRVVHNYNFDVVGDGQLYSTVEDLLRWDHHLHDEKPDIHELMLTEAQLSNGEPVSYGLGLSFGEYRGLQTVGHGGSSWGFRAHLLRFVEGGLSVAIACNLDSADPYELALRVADHYLADRLGPVEVDGEIADDTGKDLEKGEEANLALSPRELQPFAGRFFSEELDATYRLLVEDGRLMVRVEQEPFMPARATAPDIFSFDLHEPGWSGPLGVTLDFQRNTVGEVVGFALSSGSERGLAFERTDRPTRR